MDGRQKGRFHEVHRLATGIESGESVLAPRTSGQRMRFKASAFPPHDELTLTTFGLLSLLS